MIIPHTSVLRTPDFARWRSGLVAALIPFFLALPLAAAEVTTNGTGGGTWSDATTWRRGAVPKSEDEVTIRKGDAVVFDRKDGKAACAKLFIDPRGSLTFKKGAGKLVFVTPGPIECFGVIKLDGTGSADDFHELRLTGKTLADRTVKLEKGAGLIASGKARLPGGKKNVVLTSKAPDPKAADVTGLIEIKGGVLDVQRAELHDLKINGQDMDNTGTKPGERCNVMDNRFVGRSNLSLTSCDTPVVTGNSFEYPGQPWQLPAAIALNGCPLAEVKRNSIKGYYYYAFSVYGCTDCVVSGNTTEKCYVGAYCVGTAAFRGNTFREAGVGFTVTSMTGTIDDTVFEKTQIGISLAGATVQMSNCTAVKPPKGFKMVDFSAGEVTLINCNFGPEMINLPKVLPKAEKPLVTCYQILVVKVNGKLPEDSQVDARTARPAKPLAPGATDLNVRNAPAALVGGRTPLPESLSPLLLKSWVIEKDGKTTPAPEYTVNVLAPAEEGKPAKVLKTLTVRPDAKWFRPRANDATPTLEVSLK